MCVPRWALSLINVPSDNTARTTSSVVTRVCLQLNDITYVFPYVTPTIMCHDFCRNTCASPKWRYQSQIITPVCPQMGSMTDKCSAGNTARTTSSVVTPVCPPVYWSLCLGPTRLQGCLYAIHACQHIKLLSQTILYI